MGAKVVQVWSSNFRLCFVFHKIKKPNKCRHFYITAEQGGGRQLFFLEGGLVTFRLVFLWCFFYIFSREVDFFSKILHPHITKVRDLFQIFGGNPDIVEGQHKHH